MAGELISLQSWVIVHCMEVHSLFIHSLTEGHWLLPEFPFLETISVSLLRSLLGSYTMGIFSLPSWSLVTAAAYHPLPRAPATAHLVPALLFSLCGSHFRFFMCLVKIGRAHV